MSNAPVKFDLIGMITAEIAELRQDLDCRKCKACAFRDCKLAISYEIYEKLLIGAEKEREYEALMEELRQLAISTGFSTGKPSLEYFELTGEAWGRA
jgi:hypothetical protein